MSGISRESAFTPITELDPSMSGLERLVPGYAAPEQIGLHVDRLGRIATTAGFDRHVTIQAESGPTTTYSVSGVLPVGGNSAAATAAAVSTAHMSRAELADEDDLGGWMLSRGRRELSVWFNIDELTERAKGAARNTGTWARLLEGALKKQLRAEVWRNTAGGRPPLLQALPPACWSLIAAGIWNTSPDLHTQPKEFLLANIAVALCAANLAPLAAQGLKHEPITEGVYGFPVYHIERALWAEMHLALPLVKVLPRKL